MTSFDYARMINDFQNISKSTAGDKINADDINMFLETLTDVYVSMQEKVPLALRLRVSHSNYLNL